jgi:tRNA (guanine-N7-)-methyltransferase
MGRRERRRDGKPPKQLNPLKAAHSQCLLGLSPHWLAESFTDLTKPFIIDVGCGEGEWLVSAAEHCSEYNYLGVEIRYEAILVAAEMYGSEAVVINHKDISEENVTNIITGVDEEKCKLNGSGEINTAKLISTSKSRNLGFLHANLLAGDLHVILNDLRQQECCIQVIAVQYPDPHWKGKHKKRRILTKSLLRAAVAHLGEGGMFYVQSDVREVVSDVRCLLSPPTDTDDGISCTALLTFDMVDDEMCEESSTTLSDNIIEDSVIDNSHSIEDLSNAFDTHSVITTTKDSHGMETCSYFKANADGIQFSAREWLQYLPSCFREFETERANYVGRLDKPTHHLVCLVSRPAFIKSCAMNKMTATGNEIS